MAPKLYEVVVPEPCIQGKEAFAIKISLFVSDPDLLQRSTHKGFRTNPQHRPNPASAAAIPGHPAHRPTVATVLHRLSTCPSLLY